MADDLSAELGPDRSLLLVDDDEAFVKRLAKAMEKRGFEPETAGSVAAGRAIAMARPNARPKTRRKRRWRWMAKSHRCSPAPCSG